ncbi:hypothetical protein M9H77_30263 [Catharanthus roseus]|uniref:Uncharacterized protein n=1 Tax=Catharanthus roseus TaxID=4058 RepID=A0ACB9ZXN5_CATRO|nr:hypothetical protein M9H77_30263 [Catharanthus roseus]
MYLTANNKAIPTVFGRIFFGFALDIGNLLVTTGLIMSLDGHFAYSISSRRDVEELKKGKSSAIMEQRIGDNLGGFNSPHHQRPFDDVFTYRYHDMPVQNYHPFREVGYQGRPQFRGGRRGGLGGRGYHRPQEEFPRYEAWHEDNFYDDYGDNPNVGQAYHGGYNVLYDLQNVQTFTKNQFESFEGQTKTITEEMQNHNKKAKIEPIGDGRPHPTIFGGYHRGLSIEFLEKARGFKTSISTWKMSSIICNKCNMP